MAPCQAEERRVRCAELQASSLLEQGQGLAWLG